MDTPALDPLPMFDPANPDDALRRAGAACRAAERAEAHAFAAWCQAKEARRRLEEVRCKLLHFIALHKAEAVVSSQRDEKGPDHSPPTAL